MSSYNCYLVYKTGEPRGRQGLELAPQVCVCTYKCVIANACSQTRASRGMSVCKDKHKMETI